MLYRFVILLFGQFYNDMKVGGESVTEGNIECLFNVIDHILWKDWEPIGGGQLGIPRDEYSSYVSAIVDAKIGDKSAKEIADILHGFTVNEMGMTGNFQRDLDVALKIVGLSFDDVLFDPDLGTYTEQLEADFQGVFLRHGFPINYYVFEMRDLLGNSPSISKSKIQRIEDFRARWQEIWNMGFDVVRILPYGYWEQAFVLGVDYNASDQNSVPVGKTRVEWSEPGLFEDPGVDPRFNRRLILSD